MYEWAEERLSHDGWDHYEISNWARPGYACQHNLVYWLNQPYLGLGAGAHSSAPQSQASWQRWANLRLPRDYVATLEQGRRPIDGEVEAIDRTLEQAETMIMGLRLLQEGVSAERFQQRFGVSLEQAYGQQIRDLIARGLLERLPDRLRLTTKGHLLGNQVFVEFL
jgi:oxygen-independent coproporphyrinogen-3 oxidase